MKTACPACNYQFDAPDEYRGRRVACPSCRKGMEVRPAVADLHVDPDPPARYRDLPEGGVVLRMLGSLTVILSVLGFIADPEGSGLWAGIIGGIVLYGLGQIVNYLKRIELWLRPDGYEKK
jgi:hypothetical protein